MSHYAQEMADEEGFGWSNHSNDTDGKIMGMLPSSLAVIVKRMRTRCALVKGCGVEKRSDVGSRPSGAKP